MDGGARVSIPDFLFLIFLIFFFFSDNRHTGRCRVGKVDDAKILPKS